MWVQNVSSVEWCLRCMVCSDSLIVVDGWNQSCGGFVGDVDISSVEAHIGVMFYCQPFFSIQLGDIIQEST